MAKEEIAVVWLKRDLRLHDNEAIFNALASHKKVLFVYLFEPLLLNDSHYSERHFNFIKQSIVDLNFQLKKHNSKILAVEADVIPFFNILQETYKILAIYSHLETGLRITFDRDKKFKRYCKNNQIEWKENINNGVFRGLRNRENWVEKWEEYIFKPQLQFTPQQNQLLSTELIHKLYERLKVADVTTKKSNYIQQGGRTIGLKYANSFFDKRYKSYMFNISKPSLARESCSRLSPYIAWGNVSIREVFQKANHHKQQSKDKRHLGAFMSRLRWQAHFIQKFEMECSMETISVNNGYHKLDKTIIEKHQKAWQLGETGFPLVDASMRCLQTTGYINFRMRAMLVSFQTHILWQPWQNASEHLARLFLDFEPGIHFPQLQMQAGETGINNLRIYNPIKNGLEHDSEANFIKKWVPELAHLPTPFIHEPYLMTPLDQQFNNCVLGKDYPMPIVNIKINRKKASDVLWSMKKDIHVKRESIRILKKHTIADRKRMLRSD